MVHAFYLSIHVLVDTQAHFLGTILSLKTSYYLVSTLRRLCLSNLEFFIASGQEETG